MQLKPAQVETGYWRKRDLDILDAPLADYIAKLQTQLEAAALAGTRP